MTSTQPTFVYAIAAKADERTDFFLVEACATYTEAKLALVVRSAKHKYETYKRDRAQFYEEHSKDERHHIGTAMKILNRLDAEEWEQFLRDTMFPIWTKNDTEFLEEQELVEDDLCTLKIGNFYHSIREVPFSVSDPRKDRV